MVNVAAAQTFRATTAIATIIIGTVGNVLSLVVMQRPAMRNTSTAVYLSALAVADTLTLYTGQIPLLVVYFHDVNLALLSEGACKLEWYLLFSVGDAAVWLLLSLTVDRFIAVQFALKAKTFCTQKRACIVSVLVFIIALIKNLHLLFTRGLVVEDEATTSAGLTTASSANVTTVTASSKEYTCGITVESAVYFETFVRPWMGFTLYAFIPIAAMSIMNILIVVTLIKVKRIRESKVGPEQSTSKQTNQTSQKGSKTADRASKPKAGMSGQITSLTIMFLSVSIMFLVLITPSMCNLVALPYWVDTPEDWDKFVVIASVTDTLVYINHAINFFLYCISGRRFRGEFLAMVGWAKKDQRNITVVQTVS